MAYSGGRDVAQSGVSGRRPEAREAGSRERKGERGREKESGILTWTEFGIARIHA